MPNQLVNQDLNLHSLIHLYYSLLRFFRFISNQALKSRNRLITHFFAPFFMCVNLGLSSICDVLF